MGLIRRLKVVAIASAITSVLAAPAGGTVIVSGAFGTAGTSSAHQGGTVNASSVVVHSEEENSNCGNATSGRECDYSLGVVNPTEVDTPSSGGTVPSDDCYYETIQSYAADSTTEDGPQFATIEDHTEVTHTDNGSTTDLDASGTLGDFNGTFWEDDAGDELTDGDTIMCFYSSASPEAGSDHLMNSLDGPAAATEPMAFTVL